MGEYSYIGEMSHLSDQTKVGRYCSIANLVTIGAQPHRLNWLGTYPFLQLATVPTFIGNDVWIGSGAVILAGVRVGDGAVIGAGSVVTKDVPPYAIVVGNPAKVKRYRFTPEVIEGLLETKWWELSEEEAMKLPVSNPEACIEELRRRANQSDR